MDDQPTNAHIPDDDLSRSLTLARPETDESLQHLGVVGDTYTILLSGKDTAGRLCLIDMFVPPGGGPPPHRHDFEETFIVLDGEIEATFRGQKKVVRAGETLHIPANAPHQFHNASSVPARLHCICSPAGQEEMFREIGIVLPTRTSAPPELSPEEQKAMQEKALALAAKYRTEFVKP